MKHINSLLSLSLVLLMLVAGCKKDDYTGASTISPTTPTANLEIDAPSSMTEANMDIPFTITLSEAQIVDLAFKVTQTGGDAVEGADFDFTHTVIIPAFSTSGSGAITIYADLEIEETETLQLKIGETETPNVNFVAQTVDIELKNFVNPDLNMAFDWSGSANVDGADMDFCSNVDIDILVYDADGGLATYAATADCPEFLVLSGLADGQYDLLADLWYNGIVPTDGSVVSFPLTVSITQGGLFNDTWKQTNESIITSADPDYYNGGTTKPFMRVTIADGTYTYEAL